MPHSYHSALSSTVGILNNGHLSFILQYRGRFLSWVPTVVCALPGTESCGVVASKCFPLSNPFVTFRSCKRYPGIASFVVVVLLGPQIQINRLLTQVSSEQVVVSLYIVASAPSPLNESHTRLRHL